MTTESRTITDLYLFPGMGCDHRLYKNIAFPEGIKIHYLDWVSPMGANSLEEYARLYLDKIDTTRKYAIGGVSMGGMISIELGKILQPARILLISSAKGSHELPWYMKGFGGLKPYRYVSDKWIKKTFPVVERLMGVDSEEDSELFYDMMGQNSINYLRWSIDVVLEWENEEVPANVYHIHGGEDLTLPLKFVTADEVIPDGHHFMILNKPKKVSEAINRALQD